MSFGTVSTSVKKPAKGSTVSRLWCFDDILLLTPGSAVAFRFSCIGNDPGAAQLLIDLEQDPHIGEHTNAFFVRPDFGRHFADKWPMVCYILFFKVRDFKRKQTTH